MPDSLWMGISGELESRDSRSSTNSRLVLIEHPLNLRWIARLYKREGEQNAGLPGHQVVGSDKTAANECWRSRDANPFDCSDR